MAEKLDMEFLAFVCYTYGGLHHSALSFIQKLGSAADPATCLTSYAHWKRDLKEEVAIAVQRGNADIMIHDSIRRRGATWRRRRRSHAPASRTTGFRSRGRGHHHLAGAVGKDLPDATDDVALAPVARLLDLSGRRAVSQRLNIVEVESEDETVVEDTPLSQQEPCFIPETPPHSSGGGVAPGAEAAAAAELVRPPRAVPDGLGVALGAAAAEAMVTEEAAGWEPAATEVSVGLR